jgi:hypothetical protein
MGKLNGNQQKGIGPSGSQRRVFFALNALSRMRKRPSGKTPDEDLSQLLRFQSRPSAWTHWWHTTALAKTKVHPG